MTIDESINIIRSVSREFSTKYMAFSPDCTFTQLSTGFGLSYPKPLLIDLKRSREAWERHTEQSFFFHLIVRVGVVVSIPRDYCWKSNTWVESKLDEATIIYGSDDINDLHRTVAEHILQHRMDTTVAEYEKYHHSYREHVRHLLTLNESILVHARNDV